MAITEGVGIAAAGKEARAKALAKSKQITSDKKIAAEYKVDPIDRMIRDIDRNFKRIRTQESTGGVKETGRGMGDTFDPSKDFQVKRRGGYFSPDGGAFDKRNNVEVASTDLSGLGIKDDTSESTFGKSFTEQASANLADASIYKQKEDNIYRPSDNIYDSLEKITRPKIEEKKPYLDRTGDYFSKDPDKDGYMVQRKGDDMRFSQSYSRDDKGELTKNYQKEYASYLRSGESMYGSFPETTVKQLAYREKPKTTLGNLFRGTEGYIADPQKAGFTKMITRDEFDNYRRDLVKTAAEKSPYGADVEVGPKRFVEGTGFDQYARNPDFTYTKTGEKINQLQDTNIPKGEGYFFKDFYKPGEFKTKEDLNRYLTDRGAYMTNMPSNFEGGISGKGEKTDDLTSMYKSTAGDLKKENEKKEPSTLQKVGNFLGNVTNKVLGIQTAEASQIGGSLPTGAENPLSRTVPSGSFNISQEGKDQAAINRGIKAAEATGIPTGVAAQGGVTTQAARDAGVKARQEAADKRAKKMADAQGIAARNPNVSIVGGRAVAANDTARAKAQAAAVNRKLSGKSISQTKAANRASMKKAAAARNASFQARKKAGKLSKSEKTAKGQRAAKKAAAKARAQAAAKARRARKNQSRRRGTRRGRGRSR